MDGTFGAEPNGGAGGLSDGTLGAPPSPGFGLALGIDGGAEGGAEGGNDGGDERPPIEGDATEVPSSVNETPPPRCFSLGIPPAKRPANCGAPGAAAGDESLLWVLIAGIEDPGTLGAPGGLGGLPKPELAPGDGADDSLILPSIIGALRSSVTVFFKRVPFRISPSSAFVLGSAPGAGRDGELLD